MAAPAIENIAAAKQASMGDPKRSQVYPFGGIDLAMKSECIVTDHSHRSDHHQATIDPTE